ncbi:MAG: hypothetical protein KAY65_15455 [Planctomycetes bacterium]|nr:hypothetical protein [Planctomycetota bacterium]
MLIYLDANIVQYCADFHDFIFDFDDTMRPPGRKLEIELHALRQIIEMASHAEVQDLDHRWDVAAPKHLLDELLCGRPKPHQLDTYRSLRKAWHDVGVEKHGLPDAQVVARAQRRLARLNLKHPPDTLHLAEAVAMGAPWFLTNDKEILRKTRSKANDPGVIEGVTVGRPSELRARMTFKPVCGLRVEEYTPRRLTGDLTEQHQLYFRFGRPY